MKVFNIQPVFFSSVLFVSPSLVKIKEASFILVWKTKFSVALSLLRAPSRSCWCSEYRLYPRSASAESASLHVISEIWLLLHTMYRSFAAHALWSRRFGAADHALAQVWPRQIFTCTLSKNCRKMVSFWSQSRALSLDFFLGVGGVVRLTDKPRYLLLLHRGKKKYRTITALVSYNKP